jgi:hypothetical protein
MSDLRDNRSGAYDAVTKTGAPQPDQPKERATPHQKAQFGADVRPETVESNAPMLPEGLRRPRKGPGRRRGPA